MCVKVACALYQNIHQVAKREREKYYMTRYITIWKKRLGVHNNNGRWIIALELRETRSSLGNVRRPRMRHPPSESTAHTKKFMSLCTKASLTLESIKTSGLESASESPTARIFHFVAIASRSIKLIWIFLGWACLGLTCHSSEEHLLGTDVFNVGRFGD